MVDVINKREASYKNIRIIILKVTSDSVDYRTNKAYVYELHIGSIQKTPITTSIELENSNPWEQCKWPISLKAYGKAYIDGMK